MMTIIEKAAHFVTNVHKLGMILASGLHGFRKDETEAELLLSKAVNGTSAIKRTNALDMKNAKAQLQKLQERAPVTMAPGFPFLPNC